MDPFEEFTRKYRLISFGFSRLRFREKLPKQTKLEAPHLTRIYAKELLGLRFTYSDYRHILTPEGKKRADLGYLSVFEKKFTRGAQIAPGRVPLYVYWLKFYYFLELRYVRKNIGSESVDNYMLRWGYLLEQNPSFIELAKGTTKENAIYALENLI